MTGDLEHALATLDALVRDADVAALPDVAGRLEAVRTRLWARLMTPAGAPKPAPDADELLDVVAAAALIGRSPSWLRKNGNTVAGFAQPRGRGTRARWSRRALESWAHRVG